MGQAIVRLAPNGELALSSAAVKIERVRPVLLALSLAVAACRSEAPQQRTKAAASASAAKREPPVVPKPPAPEPPYNVVLIMIDALRADMPWAGYPRDIAPRLSALAKRCTLYPRAYSLSSYTAKSVVPALAGKYPSELRRDGYFFTRWMPDNVLVTEMAQQAGHRTLAGNGHGYFLPGMGVDQGYDDYRLLPGTFLDTKGVFDVTSERLNALAKQMLGDAKNVSLAPGKGFFAYFHFLDPHYQYFKHDNHPDFGNRRRDIYDNEVHFTDHWVGDLIDWIGKQSYADKTAIIVTADHGEGFGEHNHLRHAYEVWEALVRVPLILCVPGAPARRVEEPRGHIDLAPTIAELIGVTPQEPWRGKSLVAEAFGAPALPRPVIVDLPRCDLMDRRRALISGDYKLIAFGNDVSFQLYDVAKDFKEEKELSQSLPEKLRELKASYRELGKQIPNLPVVGDAPLKGARPGQRY
jgi:arylsulfatase A-like enzyme